MSAQNASKRFGLGLLGGLLAAGLLLAACAAPQGRAHTKSVTDVVFRHPGVVVGHDQLARAKEGVARGAEPWASAHRAVLASRYAAPDYTAHPVDVVNCPFNAGPVACLDERQDALAAYTHALLWSVTGETAHARKSAEIMDAWSAVMERHTGGNAGLQAAWAGAAWARAADVLRAGYPAWRGARADRFGEMLRTAYLPTVRDQVPAFNGNWELAMTDATISIAVHLEDQQVFAEALRRFRDRVPAYFYLTSDGPRPKAPQNAGLDTPEKVTTYWFGQTAFRDGLAQETCRNLMHVGYALAASAHIAETAWHQGVDLYGEQSRRLTAALEFHSRYQLGEAAPEWLCGGKVERTMGPDLEVALGHYEGRAGAALPFTRELAERMRPAGTDDLFVAWETLTHAADPLPSAPSPVSPAASSSAAVTSSAAGAAGPGGA
ncbi:alginate lyase family protein [Streptomyces sp. NPDC097619]|uniref:alginate lyase family protein n=1 Tax=Streptomyces sp. NPDC097619 TaxID=3157228 RepID=UPI0033237276